MSERACVGAACVRACVRACVCVCVCACVGATEQISLNNMPVEMVLKDVSVQITPHD